MTGNQELIAEIAREVIARLEKLGQAPVNGVAPATGNGVFRTVNEAVSAAAAAQKRVAAMSLGDRGRMCDLIKHVCAERADELARMELAETRLGRVDHKIQKLKNIRYVLGPEAMTTQAMSDATGACLIEHAPWGVIGMVLPATHCVPTLASNAINILAAGNTAVFSPHPAGSKGRRPSACRFSIAKSSASWASPMCSPPLPSLPFRRRRRFSRTRTSPCFASPADRPW